MGIFQNIVNKIFHREQTAPASSSPAANQPVDVVAVVTAMAAKKNERLNWRSSIVDLLKVLDLDSSLAARIALAKELHYSGNTSDTAAMNIWLHAQVMKKLEENGGVIPKELKATG
ncbi:MAG TPA: DUF3597 domain-containing protein [Bdellovibrionota bacterium]|jgi:hypothetical protein